MIFKTTTVKGHGRGKTLGFPTVNMRVPAVLPSEFREGIYAARAVLFGQKYNGALFYGPIPVFNQKEIALEIYLPDAKEISIAEGEPIEIEIVEFVRPVMSFETAGLLVERMEKDVATIRTILTMKP